MSRKLIHIITPILIASTGIISMTTMAYLLQADKLPVWQVSQHKIVNQIFTMQAVMLAVSFIALVLMYLRNKSSFKEFFRIGSSARAKNNWRFYGTVAALTFTLGTIMLLAPGVILEKGTINNSFLALLPFVLFFSAANAWSEEIFSRFVIVAGLYGKLKPQTICWISAIIFGVPHFFGTPSGLAGVIGAGFLGWVLAKSVIETKGLGWALFIHFLQDMIIFGAGAMILAGKQ